MPRAQDQVDEGPIDGLRLSRHAWTALGRLGIHDLRHLLSLLDRLERLPGIGPKTAAHIREEVGRLKGVNGETGTRLRDRS